MPCLPLPACPCSEADPFLCELYRRVGCMDMCGEVTVVNACGGPQVQLGDEEGDRQQQQEEVEAEVEAEGCVPHTRVQPSGTYCPPR